MKEVVFKPAHKPLRKLKRMRQKLGVSIRYQEAECYVLRTELDGLFGLPEVLLQRRRFGSVGYDCPFVMGME